MKLHELISEEVYAARRQAAAYGIMIGIALALCVAVMVGMMLDNWRVRNHERLTREAVAAVDARLSECKKDVARYADIAAVEQAYAERRTP